MVPVVHEAEHGSGVAMTPTQTQQNSTAPVHNQGGLFEVVERHRAAVMSLPFFLAAVLFVMYAFGGSQIQEVLDFFGPGRLVH